MQTTYTLCCHGCGRFHEKRAGFLSTPLGVSLPGSVPGQTWTVPQLGCAECDNATIRRAFDHGMSDEAVERMNTEWPDVRARLETERANPRPWAP